MKHVNVDTTVQTKEVRYPTDARHSLQSRERLLKDASKVGLSIKQSYENVGRRLVIMSGRYANARQMKRSHRCVHKLTTNLSRGICEIERQGTSASLRILLDASKLIRAQKRGDKAKVYSVHAPEVGCIAKGNAGSKFVPRSNTTTCQTKLNPCSRKVSIAKTSKGGWLFGTLCVLGKPHDRHTLKAQMEQLERLYIKKSTSKRFIWTSSTEDVAAPARPRCWLIDVFRRQIPKRIWLWMKRRAAAEPTIRHRKKMTKWSATT